MTWPDIIQFVLVWGFIVGLPVILYVLLRSISKEGLREKELDKLVYYKKAMADLGGVQYNKSNINKGDRVKIRHGWAIVKSAGPKNINVVIAEGGARGMELKYPYAEIQEHQTSTSKVETKTSSEEPQVAEGKLIAKWTGKHLSAETGKEQNWVKEWRLEQDPSDGHGFSYGIRYVFTKDGEPADKRLMELGMTEHETIKKFNGGTEYKEAEKYGVARKIADIEDENKRKTKEGEEKQQQEDELAEKRYNETISSTSMKGIKKGTISIATWPGWEKNKEGTYDKPMVRKEVEGYDVGNGVGVAIDSSGKHKSYTVTHLNSGLAIGHAWDKPKEAIALAKAEAQIADWSKYATEKEIPKSTMDEAASLVRGFTQKKLESHHLSKEIMNTEIQRFQTTPVSEAAKPQVHESTAPIISAASPAAPKPTSIPERRYPTEADKHELAELYHTARTAGKESRYDRMLWATEEFVKAHPEWSKGK